MEFIMFVVMLAFQLTGALVLLVNSLKDIKKSVIQNCFPGSNVSKQDNDGNCTIPRDKLQTSALKIYLNIIAFLDLILGYGLAALSPATDCSKCVTVISVLLLSGILTTSECYLCKGIAKWKYSVDIKIPYNELKEFGVETFITHKDLDAFAEDIVNTINEFINNKISNR